MTAPSLPPQSIFVVDDHPMIREGIRRLVEGSIHWQMCGEAGTAQQAMDFVLAAMPDLVITEIALPDKSGLELIRELNERAYGLRTLVFSIHDPLLYAGRAIRAGAQGYVAKRASTDSLKHAIECTLAGGIYLEREVSDHILRSLGKDAANHTGMDRLTDRELEVFLLIGARKANADIAEALGISARTVDAHRTNIRAKLALRDSPSLTREALLWVEVSGKKQSA